MYLFVLDLIIAKDTRHDKNLKVEKINEDVHAAEVEEAAAAKDKTHAAGGHHH